MNNHVSFIRDRVPQSDSCNKYLEPLDLQIDTHTKSIQYKSEYFNNHTPFHSTQSHHHHSIFRYWKHYTRIHTYNILTPLWKSNEPRRIWHIPWRYRHIYIDKRTKFWSNGNIVFKCHAQTLLRDLLTLRCCLYIGLNKAL